MDIKPVVGMTVILRPTINNRNMKVLEGTLEKIGRKYYTVRSHHQEYRFDLENRTQISIYSPDYVLYFSRDSMDDEIEREKLIRQIGRYFQMAEIQDCILSHDQLRKIADIIFITPETGN